LFDWIFASAGIKLANKKPKLKAPPTSPEGGGF